MSYCEESGKDRVIFLSKEDSKPSDSTVTFSKPVPESEAPTGLIRPDGSINWSCPCLGGMPLGPCGVEFREAFECFHYSEEEVKGSDCVEKFQTMQDCLSQYPELYENKDGDAKADEELAAEDPLSRESIEKEAELRVYDLEKDVDSTLAKDMSTMRVGDDASSSSKEAKASSSTSTDSSTSTSASSASAAKKS